MVLIIIGHLACSDPASDFAAASLNSNRPALTWIQESAPDSSNIPGEGNRHGLHLDPPLRGMSATDFQPMVVGIEDGRLIWRAATAT